MCGILYVDSIKTKSAAKPTLKRYRHQAHRGKRGFGYIAFNDKVDGVIRDTEENGICGKLVSERASRVLFHHRLPTSLPNYDEATHPIVVKNKGLDFDYYVIHNGVISNYKTLYDTLKKEGWVFTTEMRSEERVSFLNASKPVYYDDVDDDVKLSINDSEVFAIDIAKFIDGKSNYVSSNGTIAFIALQTDKKGVVKNIFYGHNNGNPLKMENDKSIFVLKSEGHGSDVPVDIIYKRDAITGETSERKCYSMSYTKTAPVGYHNRSAYEDNNEYKDRGGAYKPIDKELDKKVEAKKEDNPTPSLDWGDSDYDMGSRYENYARTNNGRLIDAYNGVRSPYVGQFPKEVEEETFESVMNIEETDFRLSLLEIEANGDASSAQTMRELAADVMECITTYNETACELNSAIILMNAAQKGTEKDEIGSAMSLLDEASAMHMRSASSLRASKAELHAWMYDAEPVSVIDV